MALAGSSVGELAGFGPDSVTSVLGALGVTCLFLMVQKVLSCLSYSASRDALALCALSAGAKALLHLVGPQSSQSLGMW